MRISDGWPNKKGCPGIVAAMLNGNLLRERLEWCTGVSSERPETRDAMVREFLRLLRWLVDQWIASGRHDGVENGWERSVHWTSEAHPTPLAEILVKFTETTNPPRLLIGPDSRFEIGVMPLFLLNRKSVKNVDPAMLAYASAVYWFTELLDSPTRERLFRCDKCGKYFVRARAPRKGTPIYHGTFCEKHKNKGGARRTVESRNRRTEEKIRWAADVWEQWKQDRRHGERAEWVAREVSERLSESRAIARNWVTRHTKEIEVEVERRKHATGKN